MNRQIEKIKFRLLNGHITCKDAMLFLRENYGKFAVELFKQMVRKELKSQSRNKVNGASLIADKIV
jgi:hypothetical protein